MPGQHIDASWQQDQYEVLLAHDGNGRIFQRAANLLLNYQFYPPNTLAQTSDFSLEKRPMRIGDRVIQRIKVATLRRRAILDIIGITEIHNIINTPRCCGFTYVTVRPHIAEGEWSAQVAWQENGNLILKIAAISRPAPQEPTRNLTFIRTRQLAMHQCGIAYFRKLLASR
ncbi:MAG: DUF1990 family protein [Ardenticatenaceae bacterium]|nr:DUF1990 family protein [Anaerolineales bacterium]MCB8920730.1 DUF1990 family protein [Ardenticatenaceae bacterium]MCB8989689.1 DUF1990 family protein [Ardenticatenaceae bacterium]MCB9002852.1 DUF1990 family protein [Ardenticatenaceae bacterium]